jgi:putative acetyltransferase
VDIRKDDLTSPEISALLEYHTAEAQRNSPPGKSYALDLSGLQQPNITVWSAWQGNALLGIGALKQLSPSLGEIKSMRTHPDQLRKGVGQALLSHMITQARARGYARLSLETGIDAVWEPAVTLYLKNGFLQGGRFGEYEAHMGNQFLHFDL